MSEDPRENAARYRTQKWAREQGISGERERESESTESTPETAESAPETCAATPTTSDRAAFVEVAIQQAIRRGDFDDLPGAGKPLDLGRPNDPDWWIRRKIESERLTGLGPPAIMLRAEDAELDDRLDAMGSDHDVREHLEDFNRRVRHARMQLLGGPPVVTALRDVDAEVGRWRERRAARAEASARARAASAPPRRRRWWRRR